MTAVTLDVGGAVTLEARVSIPSGATAGVVHDVRAALADLRRRLPAGAPVALAGYSGADHFFSSALDALGAAVEGWAAALAP